MGYVRTAGMSTAARRARRRAVLVIVALLLGLLLVFGFALAYVQGWFGLNEGGTDDAAVTTAVPAPAPSLAPEDVPVNVYNANAGSGAAGRAGEALRARSFDVLTVANDPEGATIDGVAVVRHGPEGLEEAQVLLDALPEGVELVEDGREALSVDLVLGSQWEDLAAPDADEGAETDAESTEEG
ncbi:LytR C-terminal domain-containing protein [Ornithinimicrobium sp. W1679]|uniref:LytR C-terminal domain-containing protein n=1 Tax=Ornithinimicrobium sp. W1665 TaxID=3416666 RepID=UPI003CF41142